MPANNAVENLNFYNKAQGNSMRDTERLDLPSASSFAIVAACPGQPNLKRLLTEEVVEVPDEIALSGTRIHKARETKDTAELSADEIQVYEAGLSYEKKLMELWANDHNFERKSEGPCEQRFWLNDPNTLQPVLSGKLDVHYVGTEDGKSFLLVNDWKTGWSWNLTASQRNWQLRVQGVLAWREYNNVEGVRVGFVKPIAVSDRIDFTDYTVDDLQKSERAIHQILWISNQPDAPRIAGDHCAYCPCKSICREAAAFTLLPSTALRGEQDIDLFVQQMSLEDLAFVQRRSLVIGKILDAIKDRLRKMDLETLKKVGLTKEPAKRRKITQLKEVVNYLTKFGISHDEIWTALSMSIGGLVDALRRDQGWKKAAAEGFVEGRLKDFIVEKPTEDSIVSL